jgi:aldose 1-epimerase
MQDGTEVELYTLTSSSGMVAKLTTYGATLTELRVPQKDGTMADVVLGFDSLEGYLAGRSYFGCTAGRYANRIAKGKFTLDGKEYTLATNNGPNHLHGGLQGLDKKVWKGQEWMTRSGPAVIFTHRSVDGEEGYPGNLDIKVQFSLTEDNGLRIDYGAKTDKPTILNLTNHSYFNLAGAGSSDILGHDMMIEADHYLPVDEGLIPTGEVAPVKGTPMDFTTPMAIGARIAQVEGGYDHNYCLNSRDRSLALAARVKEPKSGRVMEVLTTQPGVQFYTGNFLDGSVKGKGGVAYDKHFGFCLETQHWPDSPNRSAFPSVVLRAGEAYSETTIYKFLAD